MGIEKLFLSKHFLPNVSRNGEEKKLKNEEEKLIYCMLNVWATHRTERAERV